jgi:hypothetical protein
MAVPQLLITSAPDDGFLTATCSECPHVIFKLTSNGLKEKRLLRMLFDQHVRREHEMPNAAVLKDTA